MKMNNLQKSAMEVYKSVNIYISSVEPIRRNFYNVY